MRYDLRMLRTKVACIVVAALATMWVQDPTPAPTAPPDPYKLPGYATFLKQCAPCHGEHGDGLGQGARFLTPSPRDFRKSPLKFFSTDNGVASGKDIYETIAAGIGGTSMLPFAQLGETTCWSLVDVVSAFRERGARESLAQSGLTGPELSSAIALRTVPSSSSDLPPEPQATVDTASRGLVLWREAGCVACHGPEARGGSAEVSQPGGGTMTVQVPNLTHGVLRQVPTNFNLANRIRRGIGGTAMPGTPIPGEDLWSLVHYVRTVIPDGAQAIADPVWGRLPALRLTGELPTHPDDPRFVAAATTWLPLAPFNAFDRSIVMVGVQALVSSTHVVMRVVVPDSTRDVPTEDSRTAPDGIALRITPMSKPPVLPVAGQVPVLDRAVTYTGAMPRFNDPLFIDSGFDNPEAVCKTIAPAARTGSSTYVQGTWRHVIAVRTEMSGSPIGAQPLSVSLAVFNGSAKKGPLPVAFSAWRELVVSP